MTCPLLSLEWRRSAASARSVNALHPRGSTGPRAVPAGRRSRWPGCGPPSVRSPMLYHAEPRPASALTTYLLPTVNGESTVGAGRPIWTMRGAGPPEDASRGPNRWHGEDGRCGTARGSSAARSARRPRARLLPWRRGGDPDRDGDLALPAASAPVRTTPAVTETVTQTEAAPAVTETVTLTEAAPAVTGPEPETETETVTDGNRAGGHRDGDGDRDGARSHDQRRVDGDRDGHRDGHDDDRREPGRRGRGRRRRRLAGRGRAHEHGVGLGRSACSRPRSSSPGS